jgi:hypothetical protein
MAMFFFDMKDGVPMRDRVGIEFDTNMRLNTANSLQSTSVTEACATTKSLRSPWSARPVGKYIASSFTAIRYGMGEPGQNSGNRGPAVRKEIAS